MKRFNIVYNDDNKIAHGKGYYIIYEGNEGKPKFDSKYSVMEYNECVDVVSVGILNRINRLYDLGYKYDHYYCSKETIKELF